MSVIIEIVDSDTPENVSVDVNTVQENIQVEVSESVHEIIEVHVDPNGAQTALDAAALALQLLNQLQLAIQNLSLTQIVQMLTPELLDDPLRVRIPVVDEFDNPVDLIFKVNGIQHSYNVEVVRNVSATSGPTFSKKFRVLGLVSGEIVVHDGPESEGAVIDPSPVANSVVLVEGLVIGSELVEVIVPELPGVFNDEIGTIDNELTTALNINRISFPGVNIINTGSKRVFFYTKLFDVTESRALNNTDYNATLKIKSDVVMLIPATGILKDFLVHFDVFPGCSLEFLTDTGVTLSGNDGLILEENKMCMLYRDGSTNNYRLRGEV